MKITDALIAEHGSFYSVLDFAEKALPNLNSLAEVKLLSALIDQLLRNLLAHLTAKRGLIVQGWYSRIPRAYRFQAAAEFGHAVWISHYSSTSGMRVWDALDANTKHHGQWVPVVAIRAFAEDLARRNGTTSLYCAFVALQHL